MRFRQKTLAALVLILMAGCLFESGPESKRGSVVGNEILAGRLYKQDGKGAGGATVKVIPVKYVPNGGLGKAAPDTMVRTVKADSAGKYQLDSLPAGEYNILGELDGEYSYQDSVAIGEKTKSIPSDTLDDPGSLTAVVALEPNHDPKTVFVQVLGTNRFVNADSKGGFTLAKMAGGEYSVRIMTSLPNYTPYFGSVTVRAGMSDTLRGTIRLGYTGIPVVTGLTARYDSAAGKATITWKPAHYGFLKEYLVFRNPDSSLSLPTVPIARIKDTTFTDDLSALATLPREGESGPVRKYEYRVRVRNLSDEDGLAFGSTLVEAAPAWMVSGVMDFKLAGRSDFKASIKDSVRVALQWRNPGRGGKSLEWLQQGAGVKRVVALSGHQGTDTLPVQVPAAAGPMRFIAALEDEAGNIWRDTVSLDAVLDSPRADAGRDTLVTLFDPVRLRGQAAQEFGAVARWEWDIGNTGRFLAVSNGDTLVQAGGLAATEKHVLRVTDDDGNVALDTIKVEVVRDPPAANAGKDTTVTISDTLALKGRGSDGRGSVVKMEWDIGNQGHFVPSLQGDTLVISRTTAGMEFHVLRVTDDDGNTTLDTVKVTVLDDFPLVTLSVKNRLVAQGGGYLLSATSTDKGRIVKWEWDIGNTGALVRGSRADTGFVPTQPAGTVLTCRAVATDEDGHSAEGRINLTVNKWNLVADAPTPKAESFYSAMGEANGRFYVMGNVVDGVLTGNWNFAFDPATTTWDTLKGFPGIDGSATILGLNGKVYVFGSNNSVLEYDPVFDQWTTRSAAIVPGAGAAVLNGKIYVVGGGTKLSEYNPSSNAWTDRAPYPGSVFNPTVIAAKGKLYVLESNGIFAYDPVQNQWEKLTGPIPFDYGFGFSRAPVVILDDIMYFYPRNAVNSYIFDLATNTWGFDQSPPRVKSIPLRATGGLNAVVFGGKIYALGQGPVLQVYSPADEL